MLKLLIIEAVSGDPYHTVFAPLGPAYLASYIAKYSKVKDIDIKVIFSSGEFNFSRYTPDIVGISSVTETFNIAKRISAFVKKNKNIPVIIGGVHISALPENLTADMDVAVIGEGEQTLLDLVESIYGRGLTFDKLNRIPGIAYRENGILKLTQGRSMISPVDLIPLPDRSVLPRKKKERNIWMMTSRGCPYNCSFCSASQFWKTVRFFSPEYVVSEINELIRVYNPKIINIVDDLFIANKPRFSAIVKLVVSERINERVEFTLLGRPNLINEEICQQFKQMNVSLVSCGFESGSPKVLKSIKQGLTIEDNINATRLLNKYGIRVGAFFMMGIPAETVEDMQMTYNFIQEQGYCRGESYLMTPFPGTWIWDYAKSKGIVNNDMNWDLFAMDFYKHPKDAVIVSDIDREHLYKLYMSIRQMWERKKVECTSLLELFRGAGFVYLFKLLRHNPYRMWSFVRAFMQVKAAPLLRALRKEHSSSVK